MIEFLRGRIVVKEPDHVILDAGGVGYGIAITHQAYRALGAPGEEAELFVRLIVREESMALFGFASPRQRDVFDLLLLAKGVGPRSALAAISAMGLDRLVLAIVDRDAKLLATVPGIGKKTAEQLSLDLAKKLAPLAQAARARALAEESATGGGAQPVSHADEAGADGGALTDAPPNVVDAMAALEALGCPAAVARRAVEKAVAELGVDADTTSLIREGLKHRRG